MGIRYFCSSKSPDKPRLSDSCICGDELVGGSGGAAAARPDAIPTHKICRTSQGKRRGRRRHVAHFGQAKLKAKTDRIWHVMGCGNKLCTDDFSVHFVDIFFRSWGIILATLGDHSLIIVVNLGNLWNDTAAIPDFLENVGVLSRELLFLFNFWTHFTHSFYLNINLNECEHICNQEVISLN